MSEFDINNKENENTEDVELLKEADGVSSSKPNGGKKILREITDYIEVFAIAISVTVILLSMFFNLCFVKGDSMNNTLIDGETLVLSNLFYEPKRGDIVVFYNEYRREPLVKRVIATENETVKITYESTAMIVEVTDKNGNKEILTEEYAKYDYQRYIGTDEYTVPEGHIFVLGDNRNNSADSRDPTVGFIDERTVMGKMIFKLNSPLISVNNQEG